jgi:hypothetical protein
LEPESINMRDVIITMLPLMVSAALAPAPVIIVLLLLRGPGGLVTAAAFVGGMTIVRIAQGVLLGFVLVEALAATGGDGTGGVGATLLLVLGILLWVTAIRTFLKAEDPDEPPPAWIGRLLSASPLAAFGIGAALVAIAAKQWVFTLGALGVIGDAPLGRRDATIAYLIFVFGAEALILFPLAASAVAGEGAAVVLERVGLWLERNTRPIKIAASIVFGTYFLWKGVTGLIG